MSAIFFPTHEAAQAAYEDLVNPMGEEKEMCLGSRIALVAKRHGAVTDGPPDMIVYPLEISLPAAE
jgi:hypothetical protein